jgi:hypothetical protein
VNAKHLNQIKLKIWKNWESYLTFAAVFIIFNTLVLASAKSEVDGAYPPAERRKRRCFAVRERVFIAASVAYGR